MQPSLYKNVSQFKVGVKLRRNIKWTIKWVIECLISLKHDFWYTNTAVKHEPSGNRDNIFRFY